MCVATFLFRGAKASSDCTCSHLCKQKGFLACVCYTYSLPTQTESFFCHRVPYHRDLYHELCLYDRVHGLYDRVHGLYHDDHARDRDGGRCQGDGDVGEEDAVCGVGVLEVQQEPPGI